jgi:hypothetical protein
VAQAEAAFRRAVACKPDYAEALSNLGNALRFQGKLDEAVTAFQRTIELTPDHAQTRLHYAMTLLQQGQFAEGWAEYEWRWRTVEFQGKGLATDLPQWNGEPLNGRTILLTSEQGFGDVLQFVRYAPMIVARGGRVALAAYPPLVRLLKNTPGVATVCNARDPLPPFDCHLPLMSLPRVFETTLDTIPSEVPYLRAAPEAVAAWRQRLDELPGRKVGLVWSGDPRPHDRKAHLLDRRRSLPLDRFASLAEVPNLTLVSLQKGPAAEQVKTLPSGLALVDWMDESTDFADTAALVASLDLVITVDTAVAHLVGALGKPVWILSRYDGCWRWLKDRDDTPWYPTARLFRQSAPGDWDTVLKRVRHSLETFVTVE